MATESPLFQSSMELLGHSVSHFNGSRELDRKLVILHLANAIELILKDLLLDSGESIYKNPKETVTIHGCIDNLKARGLALPYLNKIELLIDERNSLQHRYGSPNELTTIFYMNIAIEFFRCVLKDYYGQEFDELISQFTDEKDLLAFKMREPSDESELDNLKKLARVHPLGALLSAINHLERAIVVFGSKVGLETEMVRRPMWGVVTHRTLSHYGIAPPEDLEEAMEDVRQLRNLAAHGRKDPTKEEVVKAISVIEKYEKFLDVVDIEQAKETVAREKEQRNQRRSASGVSGPMFAAGG